MFKSNSSEIKQYFVFFNYILSKLYISFDTIALNILIYNNNNHVNLLWLCHTTARRTLRLLYVTNVYSSSRSYPLTSLTTKTK